MITSRESRCPPRCLGHQAGAAGWAVVGRDRHAQALEMRAIGGITEHL